MLPVIPNNSGLVRLRVEAFGGLDRRPGAVPGAICAMENLTGRDAPVLSSRPPRALAAAVSEPRGVFAAGETLFWADGQTLCRPEGAYAAPLPAGAEAERVFAALGRRLLVWPDKVCVSADADPDDPDALAPLSASVTAGCTFADGTYAGEAAAGNTVLGPAGLDWAEHFRVGDGVTISGAADPENNKTAIVREIEGNALRFYENCFTANGTAAAVTVARTVPDLDFLCVCDNRVWGCRGDTICCCKLGDPANWNVFDGLSTDAWSVETGTAGDFTGCVSFMGYPIFFKADRVFKVYGNRPSNFELMASAAQGVAPGAGKTLAVAGETLYYLSRGGFVRYNGGYPSPVDAALHTRYTGGAAGSDGRRWFVSALRAGGGREMLVFDPETGLWHREDDLAVLGFANAGGALYAQTADALLTLGDAAEGDEADFTAAATFSDFGPETFAGKYPVRLWLRLEQTAPVTVYLRYDGGAAETAATLAPGSAGGARPRYFPLPIRRCDRFGLTVSSTGPWRLHALEIELRTERKNRKEG